MEFLYKLKLKKVYDEPTEYKGEFFSSTGKRISINIIETPSKVLLISRVDNFKKQDISIRTMEFVNLKKARIHLSSAYKGLKVIFEQDTNPEVTQESKSNELANPKQTTKPTKPPFEFTNWKAMNKAEVTEWLRNKKIEHDPAERKPALVKLAKKIEKEEAYEYKNN